MADRTAIEWTDATWTPLRARNKATGQVGWHCEHASPGCQHCYSESFNEKRLGTGLPFKPGHRGDVEHFLDEAMLVQPLRWRRPRRIFVCSMTDLFGEWVEDAWIDRVFAVMALCPQHTFQVLTKRSARMRAYVTEPSLILRLMRAVVRIAKDHGLTDGPLFCQGNPVWPFPNVWLGVSVEDQRRADERVPDLLATPAAVRFVSAEPLLGPIDFTLIRRPPRSSWLDVLRGTEWSRSPITNGRTDYTPPEEWTALDQIIVGGESGPDARAMHPAWVRPIRDECAAAGVAFFFKQWGAWLDERDATALHLAPGPAMFDRFGVPNGPKWHPYEAADRNGGMMIRVGKKAAGRLLDGVEHNAMPRGPA